MKRVLLLLSSLVFSIAANAQKLGIEKIITNQFYVVHSGMDNNNTLVESSNIYVIKGTNDSVWVFGAGYGDQSDSSGASDLTIYKGGNTFEPTANAIDDVRKVDTIITNYFGISKTNCVLMIVVPHGHLDHINKEFVAAFFETLGYPNNGTNIFVHTNDYFVATCNDYYCGNKNNKSYFGAPYRQPWTSAYLPMFRSLGNPNDIPNKVLLCFTSACNTWTLLKGDTLHTTGSINLDNAYYKMRILGAAPDNAFLPGGWSKLPIHGDIKMTTGLEEEILFAGIQLYPNPATDRVTLSIEDYSNTSLKIFTVLGQLVLQNEHISSEKTNISLQDLPRGIYFLRLQSGEIVMDKKLVVQ